MEQMECPQAALLIELNAWLGHGITGHVVSDGLRDISVEWQDEMSANGFYSTSRD